jgi:hypothetical protein
MKKLNIQALKKQSVEKFSEVIDSKAQHSKIYSSAKHAKHT